MRERVGRKARMEGEVPLVESRSGSGTKTIKQRSEASLDRDFLIPRRFIKKLAKVRGIDVQTCVKVDQEFNHKPLTVFCPDIIIGPMIKTVQKFFVEFAWTEAQFPQQVDLARVVLWESPDPESTLSTEHTVVLQKLDRDSIFAQDDQQFPVLKVSKAVPVPFTGERFKVGQSLVYYVDFAFDITRFELSQAEAKSSLHVLSARPHPRQMFFAVCYRQEQVYEEREIAKLLSLFCMLSFFQLKFWRTAWFFVISVVLALTAVEYSRSGKERIVKVVNRYSE